MSDQVLIHLVVETDYQLVALEDCWSPQVSGRSQHQFDQISPLGFVLFQIVGDHLLALGGVEEFGLFYQLRGFLFGHFGLASVFFFLDGYGVRVEKLSSLFATRSALAEIHPVNCLSHTSLH